MLGLTACARSSSPSSAEFTGTRPVALSDAQRQVVDAGVREMMQNAQQVGLKSVTAIKVEDLPGVHVCGHVTSGGRDLPFYIELREASGAPVAERGQVGTDASNFSKVKFMCRRHG
jgi:hypothetical protein